VPLKLVPDFPNGTFECGKGRLNAPYLERLTNGRGMPIRPFLSGQAFEPEIFRQMSLALENACDTLKLKLIDDPNTRLVAAKIIELAQRGVKDAATLSARTLKEFKHY